MDDQARWYEERQAIIAAQQQAHAEQQLQASRLMAQQPDLWQQTTLQSGDWGIYQEVREEQRQNALEAERDRAYQQEQQRQALER